MERLTRFFRVLAHNLRRSLRPSYRARSAPPFAPDLHEKARRIQAQTGEKDLSQILIQLGLVGDREVRQAHARELGVGFVDLERIVIGEAERRLLPPELLLRHRILPVKKRGSELYLAMETPTDTDAIEQVQALAGCRVIPVMTGTGLVDEALADLTRAPHFYDNRNRALSRIISV